MDNPLEFSAQAFCKMIMHTMKYPYSICCGLLLSQKPMSGDLDSGTEQKQPLTATTKIIDVMPVLHTSHYLAPTMEVALNAIDNYAKEHELFITGYYQVDKFDSTACLDVFSQRITEKIAESNPNAVLCLVNFELDTQSERSDLGFCIDQHQLIDGKWRRKPTQSYTVEQDVEAIKKHILCSQDKLYRQITDFDDHLNNINLDWTNAEIGQIINHLVVNVCKKSVTYDK